MSQQKAGDGHHYPGPASSPSTTLSADPAASSALPAADRAIIRRMVSEAVVAIGYPALRAALVDAQRRAPVR